MPAHAVVETRRQDTPAGRQRVDSGCLASPASVVVKGFGGVWRGEVLGWKYVEVWGCQSPVNRRCDSAVDRVFPTPVARLIEQLVDLLGPNINVAAHPEDVADEKFAAHVTYVTRHGWEETTFPLDPIAQPRGFFTDEKRPRFRPIRSRNPSFIPQHLGERDDTHQGRFRPAHVFKRLVNMETNGVSKPKPPPKHKPVITRLVTRRTTHD